MKCVCVVGKGWIFLMTDSQCDRIPKDLSNTKRMFCGLASKIFFFKTKHTNRLSYLLMNLEGEAQTMPSFYNYS